MHARARARSGTETDRSVGVICNVTCIELVKRENDRRCAVSESAGSTGETLISSTKARIYDESNDTARRYPALPPRLIRDFVAAPPPPQPEMLKLDFCESTRARIARFVGQSVNRNAGEFSFLNFSANAKLRAKWSIYNFYDYVS